MKIYIKNIVCSRCKMVIKAELEMEWLQLLTIEHGEVEVQEEPSKEKPHQLDELLKCLGFKITDNDKSKTIDKIKTIIIKLVRHSNEYTNTNLSEIITSQNHQDYNYLSSLFLKWKAYNLLAVLLNK